MQRATITVIEDRRGLVERPALGQPVDLMASERNGIGRLGDVLVRLNRDARLAHRVDFVMRGEGWAANAFGDRAVVDGEPLENAGWRMLRHGARVGWPDLGITLRFDVVSAAPLERVVRHTPELLLFDCAGIAAPGRWPCLTLDDSSGAVTRGLAVGRMVAGMLATGHVVISAIGGGPLDGVPIRVLCARARVLEADVAIHIAAAIARHFVAHAKDAGSENAPEEFAVTWEGEVVALPPIFPRPQRSSSDGRGAIVETLIRLLPAEEPIVRDDGRVQDLFRVMLDPYLGALDGREPQLGDVVTAAHASEVLDDAAAHMRPVLASELASIARGLCPDSWRREQQLREELALLDDSGARALFT